MPPTRPQPSSSARPPRERLVRHGLRPPCPWPEEIPAPCGAAALDAPASIWRRGLREPANGLTHLFGALLALAGLGVLVQQASLGGTALHLVSVSIYGTSLFVLYLTSSVFHLLPVSPRRVQTLLKLDHMAIFLLIAGTYTPFCLVTLQGPWGWSMFGVVWGLAAAGLLLKQLWPGTPRWLSTAIYVGMGWVVVPAIPTLMQRLPTGGLVWLVAGGLCYTGGAVIYATRKPDPWPEVLGYHVIWHLWVMAGSACHFWAVLRFVLPSA